MKEQYDTGPLAGHRDKEQRVVREVGTMVQLKEA